MRESESGPLTGVDMSFLPEFVREQALIERFAKAGLRHLATGKAREMFELSNHSNCLLIYTTDRLSAFDQVIGDFISRKGEVLTALTVFWLTEVFTDIKHHLLAFGAGIDRYLPKPLQGDPELQKRCLVVKKAQVLPVEAIVRGHLAGSGYKDYRQTGTVCGHQLPSGLHEGSKLPKTLFTPSTKAAQGEHDKNFKDFKQMVAHLNGDLGAAFAIQGISIGLFERANQAAGDSGIVIADTKFEFGIADEEIVLIDEVLTPDSSRFWPKQDSYDGTPPSRDKQPVRDHIEAAGIKDDPIIVLPQQVVNDCTENYLQIARIFFGESLEDFQGNTMLIKF